VAQESSDLARLGLRTDGAQLPSVGSVLLALAFTLAIGIAVIFALRRFWPPAALQRTNAAAKVSAQVALSASLKLHVVELGETRLVVAESRGGVAIAELARNAASGTSRTSDAG
jgi:flagellar biogenesis protein FliO